MRQKQKYLIAGILCASVISGLLAYSIHSFIYTSGTGTVVFLSLEGGFYGIIADNNERYDPTNLADHFQIDGLRVQFVVRELRGVGSIHMWGKIVKILHISKI
ncbi:MAG: hypothetical protein ACW986_06295 [Promethearchaeota archaeon]|jgi:hypothetical protein